MFGHLNNPLQCKTCTVDLMQPIVVQGQLQVHICMCHFDILMAVSGSTGQSSQHSVQLRLPAVVFGQGYCISIPEVLLELT